LSRGTLLAHAYSKTGHRYLAAVKTNGQLHVVAGQSMAACRNQLNPEKERD